MNRYKVVTVLAWALFGWIPLVHALEQPLTPSEVNALIQTLASNPRMTWLPAGSITAQCLKYQHGEPGVTESVEDFHFNGNRFYWHIRVKEDTTPEESPQPDALARARRAECEMNRERIFCWDGRQYTRYYKSAGYAVMIEHMVSSPLELYGPFSAGIIPWGYGDYSEAVLSKYEKSAVRITEAGSEIIRLTILNHDIQPALNMVFELDPGKNHAALSYSLENEAAAMHHLYGDFTRVGGQWIPQTISVEKYDKQTSPPTLLSYEDWSFETISGTVPSESAFQVVPANETLVELAPYEDQKSYLFHYSDQADIASLLDQKVALSTDGTGTPQNCATAAAWHIARKFKRPVTSYELSPLVDSSSGQTSLYHLRRKLEGTGLYCSTVTAQLEDLKKYPRCTALIHLTDASHYVVLDHVDDMNVWFVDLTSRKFYWKKSIRDFLVSWKDRTALLVSDDPLNLPMDLNALTVTEEMQVMGGELTGFSCTDQLQITERILCSKPSGGFLCFGVYYKIWERYGCQEDAGGGTCSGEGMIGYEYSACVNNPDVLGTCTLSGKWLSRYIRACM